MKHLDLVCLADERERVLEDLRTLGAVHLNLSSAQGAAVAAAKGAACDAEKAVRLILKFRPDHDIGEPRLRSVTEVLALDADRQVLLAERDRLEKDIRFYTPYGDFDPELAAKMLSELAARGLADEAALPLPEKLPAMRLSRMLEKLHRVENRIRISEAQMALADERAILKQFPDLADRIAFEQARELVDSQGALAFVSGWVPTPLVERLRVQAAELGWGLWLRDPEGDEVPPTLIEPPKFFRSMKALFGGLGIAPAYSEADVSVPFMCYFSLFFAMLVGDGAYGAIFLIVTLLLRKRLPRSWFVLLAVFSTATIVWGVLSNTWFGASLPWCRDWVTVRWLADATYHNMMLLCFTIGASHLMLARLWNGICKLNDSTCVADFGWAGILLFMYLVTNSIVGIFSGIPRWGFWVFGFSLAAVFGFSVKPSELKTRGAELGMLPLNIMSALGDIISYVRLFAVGLASVKVAENFNSMAMGLVGADKPLWVNLVFGLALAAILIIGHGLNLAMAGLSILVHAVRLNTLEFSNHKGVTWSGYAYRAFSRNMK